jgi:hypothetical protein
MTQTKNKINYFYPEITGNKILYKGKRFWIFEISSEFPFQGYEEFSEIIVFDKHAGSEMAAAKKTADGYEGSLIGPQESVGVSGNSPTELLESVINAFRNYERHFVGFISPSTPRFRKRIVKK